MVNSSARSQSSHDNTRKGREGNVRHDVKIQPADGKQQETTLAVREDDSRHVLPIDMGTTTNQRTLGRIRPIADEDMAVGGAEVQVLAAAEIPAIVDTTETINRTSA